MTSPPLVSRPALRAAVAGDAATLAGMRHEFRGGLAPAVEAEAAFLDLLERRSRHSPDRRETR